MLLRGLAEGTGGINEDAIHVEFEQVYFAVLFLACVWVGGKIAMLVKVPSLVGYILVGILLGPNLADFVPFALCFQYIGQVGLYLLIIEAGLDVDLEMLRIVGLRGAGVAFSGSMIPLAIGFLLAKFVMGLDTNGAFVVGAAFAPTSMGIALDVLRNNKVLHTAVGQLIIAAAILDDIIALVLLSEVRALNAHSSEGAWVFVEPILVAAALLVGFGVIAIYAMPPFVHRFVFVCIPEKDNSHDKVILGLVFLIALALSYLAEIAGSSALLGCFIAGMCFCTETAASRLWISQVKRILSWLLRIFFACTIGFTIPVRLFADTEVVLYGLMLFVCFAGKFVTGFFAPPPFEWPNMLTIGFAMSVWGEFAFYVILEGHVEGSVDEKTMASVVLAILISIVVSPILLRVTLIYQAKVKRKEAMRMHKGQGLEGQVPLYYFLQTKSIGSSGQQDQLLKALIEADVHVVDMRSFHPSHNNLDVKIVYTFFLKDNKLSIPVENYFEPMHEQNDQIELKLQSLHSRILEALNDPNAVVRVGRWFSGMEKGHQVMSDLEEPTTTTSISLNDPPTKLQTESHGTEDAMDEIHSFLDQLIAET